MKFEWDETKDRQNRFKHRVGFSEAATVFGDPFAVTFPDGEHSITEDRYLTIGQSRDERILVIAHTDRGENTRIISARKATRKERHFYEDQT